MLKRYIILLLFMANLFYLNAQENKHILLLNSYHQGMTWVDNLTKGVFDTLDPKENKYIIHIENMDTKRHFSPEYLKSLAELYKNKYSNIKLDLILASDNNAFDFLREYRNNIFGNIPVSFSGVNNFEPSMLNGHENYTGVQENFSVVETVDLILKLHPKTKKIYIINDYLKTGRLWEKDMKKQLKPFSDKIEIIYAPNQTIDELRNRVKGLSEDTVLLMGVFFADKNKKYITYEKIGEYILDISKVPVYCLLQFNISDGVIGGKVISSYYQGAMMAKLGKKILQGTKADKIDIVSEDANRFIFNKKALVKFGVVEGYLPAEKEIINDEISLYEKYESLVFAILLFFIGSAFFAIYIYYKKEILDEKKILRIIVYGPIIFIPAIIAVLIYIILHNSQINYIKDVEELKKEHIQRQKDITRSEVQRVVNYVYMEHRRMNEQLKKLITAKPYKKEELEVQFYDSFMFRVLNYIENYKYGTNGYMFVLNDMGTLMAHGAYPQLLGQNMYDEKDENGIYYAQQIIEKAKSNSLKFTEYLWKNPENNHLDTKYTYSEYIPEYDMIISSGVYSGDMDKMINKKGLILKHKNDTQIEQILFIASVVLIVAILLSFVLSNIIKNIFQNYSQELDKNNDKLKRLNESLEDRIKEELLKNQEKDKMLHHQSKMASMGEMLENIAHQWRQPLNSISVAASGIQMQKEGNMLRDEDLEYYMGSILKNTSYLSQTIDDFRELFKKDKKTSKFILNNAVEHSLNVIASYLKKHDIEVVNNCDKEIELNTYKGEVIQSFMNILNNAKDVLMEKDMEVRLIVIATKLNGDKVDISFLDNGGGIKEDIIDKVFEAYFTTKHQSQGTGLGMHMTYNIILQHLKGDIKVVNKSFIHNGENYKGAEFTITLPLN